MPLRKCFLIEVITGLLHKSVDPMECPLRKNSTLSSQVKKISADWGSSLRSNCFEK